jgi:hypothetical protein
MTSRDFTPMAEVAMGYDTLQSHTGMVHASRFPDLK